MKYGIQHNLVYIIVLKWLALKIIVICEKLRIKLRFYVFLCFFGSYAHKVAQTWFVLQETLYIVVQKFLELKIIGICQKLHVKLRFYGCLSFFGTFAHEVAQTWFVLHETWHTIVFGTYYCVQVVRIENHSQMLEKYVLSCDFMGFKAFLALSRIKQLKLCLFCMKHATQHYLVYYCVEVVRNYVLGCDFLGF